jgi:FAD/FMN-containing dehydrogenase
MRGAADSFGIAVNFYLQTQPAPERVVCFSLSFSESITSADTATNAFLHFQDVAHNDSLVDRNLSFGIFVSKNGDFNLIGTYLGSLEAFSSTILPELLRDIPKPMEAKTRIVDVDWISSLKILGGDDLTAASPYTERGNFFAKSAAIPEPGFPKASIRNFFDYVFTDGRLESTPVGWYTIFDLFGGADSQINTKNTQFAAYRGRNLTWVAQIQGVVDITKVFPEEGIAFIQALHDAMTQGLPAHGAYVNYVDSSLTKDEAHDMYYGEKLYKRLRTIKKEVDPDNVFANPQSI